MEEDFVIQDHHFSVLVLLGQNIYLTIVNICVLLGPLERDRRGRFHPKEYTEKISTETMVFKEDILTQFWEILTKGIAFFQQKGKKDNFKRGITPTMEVIGRQNKVSLKSKYWLLEFESKETLCQTFKKTTDQIIYASCVGHTQAKMVSFLTSELAERKDSGKSVFENWCFTNLSFCFDMSSLSSDEQQVNVMRILGLKELILIALKLQKLYNLVLINE